jgi:hypothetical protein
MKANTGSVMKPNSPGRGGGAFGYWTRSVCFGNWIREALMTTHWLT